MPALLRYVGEEPGRAVGTNLCVGVCVGVAGVIGHAPTGIDWTLLAIGGLASIPSAIVGARLTGRLPTAALLRAIGAVLSWRERRCSLRRCSDRRGNGVDQAVGLS